MQNFKSILLIFLYLLSSPTLAYEAKEGNVTANLGPFIYKTNFKGSDSGLQSPQMGGLGLLVNGDINDKGALEIAMFYMNKIFFREQSGGYQVEETNLIHITMGYRRYLSSALSASLALYSSYSFGDPRIVHSDFTGGELIDTSARDITEYGFDSAIQYEIWAEDRYAAVADLRYAYSLTNKFSERSDHYGIFLALRYFVQDKEDVKRPKNPRPKK